MKKQRVVGIVLIHIIFTISSCTLTKRHNQPGYHVEWHFGKNVSTLKPQQFNDETLLSGENVEPYYQEYEHPVLIASENSDPGIECFTHSVTEKDANKVLKLSEHRSDSEAQSSSKLLSKKSLPQKHANELVVHWTAGAALGLGILGFVVPFFPCIAAIVFGIVALNKINSEPDTYRGRGLAIAGIVLGALGIVFIIGLAVLMFMAFL
jgi:hypothetical protein